MILGNRGTLVAGQTVASAMTYFLKKAARAQFAQWLAKLHAEASAPMSTTKLLNQPN